MNNGRGRAFRGLETQKQKVLPAVTKFEHFWVENSLLVCIFEY